MLKRSKTLYTELDRRKTDSLKEEFILYTNVVLDECNCQYNLVVNTVEYIIIIVEIDT